MWLKSLRLHKYQDLFQSMTYQEMMGITEEFLEQKVRMYKLQNNRHMHADTYVHAYVHMYVCMYVCTKVDVFDN